MGKAPGADFFGFVGVEGAQELGREELGALCTEGATAAGKV